MRMLLYVLFFKGIFHVLSCLHFILLISLSLLCVDESSPDPIPVNIALNSSQLRGNRGYEDIQIHNLRSL